MILKLSEGLFGRAWVYDEHDREGKDQQADQAELRREKAKPGQHGQHPGDHQCLIPHRHRGDPVMGFLHSMPTPDTCDQRHRCDTQVPERLRQESFGK
jgi:hypothetical protein